MPKNMLIHDVGLQGRTPTDMAQNNWDVPAGTTTAHVMGWAAAYATSQHGLDNLFIMCHGYEGGVHDGRTLQSTFDLGFGLALGAPGLTFDNVRLASGLNGKVSTITLFACGPAHTRTGFENTTADGMRFCGEFALIAGAEVIAAVETQYYYHTPTWWDRLRGRDGAIDFGAWEGPVFRFSPADGRGSRVM
jgi:hypothetical protein